jgi:hypothetical protein
MNPRLVVVRDQFALQRLSDEALRQVVPALQQAQRQILADLEQALEGRDSTDRALEWFITRRAATFATIQAQLAAVGDRLDQVLPGFREEAFLQGLGAAEDYLQALEPPGSGTAIGQGAASGELPGVCLLYTSDAADDM